ncbi:MAG: alpha-hydroxy acid oxidase [Chloroflexota bacterium]
MPAPHLTPDEVARIWSTDELEPLARERLRDETYRYVAGWAGTGGGVRINREAFDRWVFRPRILVDISAIDLGVTVLGRRMRTPILLGASALHRLSHPDGELATARAAAAAGSLMMVSTSTSTSLEAIAENVPDRWMQLYWMNDRAITRDIVARAEAAGFGAIALTVDAPYMGWREDERRMGDWDTGPVTQVVFPDPWPEGLAIDRTLTWKDLDWLRGITRMPIVLKGVMTPEDAAIAAREGIPGIIVSNHGGRQVDATIGSLDALPPIAEAVAGGTPAGGVAPEIYLDSGVRRGTDVLKALALGARAVFVGRLVHWALATGGQPALDRMFTLMNGELESVMGLCGQTRADAIDPSILERRPR